MVNIYSLKNLILKLYPVHSQKINLEELKKQLRRQKVAVDIYSEEDNDLIDFLNLQGYMNIETHPDVQKNYQDNVVTKEEDFDLASFFEDDFDDKELLLKSSTHKDNKTLFEYYEEDKNDSSIRERIIIINQRLVQKEAKRYEGLAKSLTFEDLVNEGNIGLMIAITKYDRNLGYEFSTYATNWIKQAILRAIANKSTLVRIPVYAVDLIKKINRLERELSLDNTDYKISDVCNKLDISIEKYLSLKNTEYKFMHELSLNNYLSTENDTDEIINFIPITDEDLIIKTNIVEDTLINENMKLIIAEVLNSFKDRDKEILQYRFGFIDGQIYTLEQVGKKFSVTRERIRQIESKALSKLRYNKDILALIEN